MRTIPHSVRAHYGTCDASAAVALGPSMFVAASDEDNVLRIYASNQDGAPLAEVDLSKELDLRSRDESDLEAAAWLGRNIFWIGSHDTLDDGDRYRFFANRFDFKEGKPRLRLTGKPYAWLLRDLIDDKRFASLKLKKASRRHPKKKGGLSIEGLAATRKGALLIGLRNPIRDGHAIVAKLKNPREVVKKGKRCRFGKPLLLDLAGLGIRSMDYLAEHDCYLIVAGPHGAEADFRLFRWSGKRSDRPEELCRFSRNWYVEALLPAPGGRHGELLVISDDGMRVIDGCVCKKRPEEERYFRSGLLNVALEEQDASI